LQFRGVFMSIEQLLVAVVPLLFCSN
jgi:hypothetical protein